MLAERIHELKKRDAFAKKTRLQLGLLLPKRHVVAADEMHQRSRVCLLALHVVTLNMLDVFIACNPCTRTSESLRAILKNESEDGMVFGSAKIAAPAAPKRSHRQGHGLQGRA